MRTRRERGSASIFVIGMSIVLLVCAGLVVDGGLAINARMRVADDAEQAARVGADSIDLVRLRTDGQITIDPGEAGRRATAYLRDRGYVDGQYRVDPQGDSVLVRLEDTSETALLKLINIRDFVVTANATAVAATGPD